MLFIMFLFLNLMVYKFIINLYINKINHLNYLLLILNHQIIFLLFQNNNHIFIAEFIFFQLKL